MKIESARYNNVWDNYSITFHDGITLIVDGDYSYVNMISTGLDSYYMKKGKWPTSKSRGKRISLGAAWIKKNKNRYKNNNKVAELSGS